MKREFLVEDDLVLEKCSFVPRREKDFAIKYISYEHMKMKSEKASVECKKLLKNASYFGLGRSKRLESLVLSQSMYLKAFWDIAVLKLKVIQNVSKPYIAIYFIFTIEWKG